jgi:hypothetical protein
MLHQRAVAGGAASQLRRRYSCASNPRTAWSARSRAACRVAAPAQPQASPFEFEWQFEHSETSTRVHVFGVDHRYNEEHIGRFIIAEKPDAVIVETACNPAHGSVPGNLVSCDDYFEGADGFFLRMFCAVAHQLQIQGEQAFAPGGVWDQVRPPARRAARRRVARAAAGPQPPLIAAPPACCPPR